MIQGAAEEILCRGIVLHALKEKTSFWNAVLYSVPGLNLSGNEETVTAVFNMQSVGDNIWNGSIYGIEASAATTIVLAFAAVVVFVMGRKKGKKNDKF